VLIPSKRHAEHWAFSRKRVYQQVAILAAILFSLVRISWGQVNTSAQTPTPSLTEALKRADSGQVELNIFYIHGMGIDAPNWKTRPQEFEVSKEFRTSLCNLIQCTTRTGELERREYANVADFAPDAAPPHVSYFGEDVWKPGTSDWRAAAPFVDHYKLVRKNGTTIYVHEINWWPLVLSAKCREIVAKDAALVDRDQKHTKMCSAAPVQDGNNFRSYAWILQSDERKPPWPRAATVNRWLKHDILDWGFADALLALGPVHEYLVEGIRELVLDSFDPSKNQEFVVVSHSLGSYLMFSALDLKSDPKSVKLPDWENKFRKVLGQTSHIYFLANQVRLLAFANLDDSKNGNLTTLLRNWKELRDQAQQAPPQIVAWSDPDDLLTWQVPDPTGTSTDDVIPTNLPVKNAHRWLWLLANPVNAHLDYEQDKQVLREMVPKSN
jgi:hypothetical protein